MKREIKKYGVYNGHTWIVMLAAIICMTLICGAVIAVLTLVLMHTKDESTIDIEIGAIAFTPYAGFRGIVVISEILTGREITERIEDPKKD